MQAVTRTFLVAISLALLACAGRPQNPEANSVSSDHANAGRHRPVSRPQLPMIADDLQHRTFLWFWDTANPRNGLVPDRWPKKSFSSIAAVGFGLTAYGVGVERGWVNRNDAAARVLTTLRWFLNAPSGAQARGVTGYKGFYYHFLDMESGERFEEVELSTIDTTLLLAGALFTQSYFDRDNETEKAIRDAAEELYLRADWQYFLARPPLLSMGWTPEHGLHTYDWRGLNEAMIVYILALGSPTHPVDPAAWQEYTSTYRWATFYGQEHVNFGPLFGHQYSQVWIDFRGIQDAYMRQKGIDYFENSRRATLAQRSYAIENPAQYRGYGPNMWGLSACDGPFDQTVVIDGRSRTFTGYSARAAAAGEVRDDGTICPTAAISSVVFTPEISVPAMQEMYDRFGELAYKKYGFIDSFNETLNIPIESRDGAVVPGRGWFDGDHLGIDQGPIVAMLENYRSELIWKTMKKNPHVVQGLRRAGFTGGWLDSK